MIDGQLYPYPDHADGCPAQVKERFVRVQFDGASCVVEPNEAEAWSKETGAGVVLTDVMLTRDQFERMPEFQGF